MDIVGAVMIAGWWMVENRLRKIEERREREKYEGGKEESTGEA